MKKYTNVLSLIKKPQYWEDAYHVYALLSQKEMNFIGPDGADTTQYQSDYTQYTKEEWRDLLMSNLKQSTLNQLDQSLETIRANKIKKSKELLEQYYQEHPLFSKVHKTEGEFYSVTSEKQIYLQSMLNLCEHSTELGTEFTPTWNATGEPGEIWTLAELKQLSLQIAEFVYPLVKQQQQLEKTIKELTTVEEIQSLEINYPITD